MQQSPLRHDHPTGNHQASGSLMRRLDRLAGEMNAFLLVLAIGLAVLDFTCFMTLTMSEALQHPFQPLAEQPAPSGGGPGQSRF